MALNAFLCGGKKVSALFSTGFGRILVPRSECWLATGHSHEAYVASHTKSRRRC